MITNEKNEKLKEIYMEKMQQYLQRAEYIKKVALNEPAYQIAPVPQPQDNYNFGVTTGSAEKKEKKEDDDVEFPKMLKKLFELNSENKSLKDCVESLNKENQSKSEEIERLREENA